MMKNNKVLISIKKLAEIEEYKKIGITNFLFAVKGFSIGYPEFTLEELKALDVNIYLNINIIMDTKKINDFKKIIPELSFVKGILFEDLGVYYVLKESNIFLVWNQTHFGVNSISINSWLKRVDSAVLANELTREEIISILDKVDKPIILPIFGYNMAMYSRRYLLSNFELHKEQKVVKEGILKANETNSFAVNENDNGTALFYHKPFNYTSILEEINDDKILFYYIDGTKISVDDYPRIIDNTIESEEKFLNNKTIFKLEDQDG